MQYAQTFALVSAALAALATAQPHNHGHAHFHHEREAEADPQMAVGRPVGATGNALQEVTITQTATAQSQQTTVVSAEAWKPSTTAAAQQATQHTKQQTQQTQQTQQPQHTTVQTSVRSSAVATAASSASKPTTSSGSGSGSGSSTGGSSSGSPTVKIINQCGKSIWIGEGNNDMQELKAGASPFQTPLSGSSISWKMGWDSQASWTADNAEIEFTVTGSNAMTYDLSLQKGNPFLQQGQKLELSDSSCQAIHCAPGQFPCPNAYNTEADNSKVGQPSLPCSKASITFTACSG